MLNQNVSIMTIKMLTYPVELMVLFIALMINAIGGPNYTQVTQVFITSINIAGY